MKKMNKVIAIMMMMSITFAMPAMAGNNKKNDKKHDVGITIRRVRTSTRFLPSKRPKVERIKKRR